MTSELAEWDSANSRFRATLRCPYPDCARPLARSGQEGWLDWCPACRRAFEHYVVRNSALDGRDLSLERTRRPDAAWCTHTGRELLYANALDWSGIGGGPERAGALWDPGGRVFGPPDFRLPLQLRERWTSAAFGPDSDERISSVTVLLGSVVVVSMRGRIMTLNITDGSPKLPLPLEWPDGSVDPYDPERAVVFPPALRSRVALLTTAHQIQFRDLGHAIGLAGADGRTRLVTPSRENRFQGPPLVVDTGSSFVFCMLEGRGDASRWYSTPVLRFFDRTGEQVSACEAPDIARPPVYDRSSGLLLWIDQTGCVFVVPGADCAHGPIVPLAHDPLQPLRDGTGGLRISARATFLVAPDHRQKTEIWLAYTQDERELRLCRASLDAVRSGSWSWELRAYPVPGQVHGLAVGLGSRQEANTSGDLVAVTTEMGVYRFSKAVESIVRSGEILGNEGGAGRGSFDPPVINSAGVIARTSGALFCDGGNTRWAHRVLRMTLPNVRYERAQGLALFGRAALIGCGGSVHCVDLLPPKEP